MRPVHGRRAQYSYACRGKYVSYETTERLEIIRRYISSHNCVSRLRDILHERIDLSLGQSD